MPRGGRAAGAPPAAGEDVATRVTLSYALGNLGGRQKSWMAPGQPSAVSSHPPTDAPPKKRGRPRQYPERYEPVQQAPAGVPAREQPASNSTSPQLANVLSHPSNGRPVISPTAVLPSPSPSEEANIDYYAPPAPGHGRQTLNNGASGSFVPVTGDPLVRNISHEDRFLEGARQAAAAAPKRPAAGTSPMLANKRTRPSLSTHGRPVPPPLRTNSINVDYQDLSRRVSAGPLESASPIVNQPFSPFTRQPSNSQSPFQSPYQRPLQPAPPQRIPSQTRTQTQNGPTQSVPSPLGLPCQSPLPGQNAQAINVAPPAGPQGQRNLLAHSLQAIEHFKSQNDLQQESSDRKRLTALELAAKRMDWEYLMTHLFYCLLTLNPAALPSSIRKSSHAARTEQFLSEVLDLNTGLQSGTKAFFVQFPLPLPEWALIDPPQYRIDVENFYNLMRRSANYFALKKQCDERDLPPTMHELVFDLGIRSRQLQSIVFTASVRRLWFRAGLPLGDILINYENETLQCFSTTQEAFKSRQHQGFDLDRERDLEMRSWVAIFRGLRSTYVPLAREALQRMQPGHQVPVLASQYAQIRPPRPQQTPRMPSGHNGQSSLAQQLVYPDPRLPPQSAQAAIQQGRGRPRGRPRLATQQPRPQPHPLVRPVPERQFLPPPGHYQPQQNQPNPARFGLHQAHLRSPNLHSKTGERLYLYAHSFIGMPKRPADARNKVERWTFTLSPEQMARIPENVAGVAGSPPVRIVDENSLMLRLRCVKWDVARGFNEHEWATSDTSWIPYSYFELNKQPLEQRKKLHHGKDLPIELTSLVKEGVNILEIGLVRAPENEQFRNYLLAIEILGVKPHTVLMDEILRNKHVSSALIKQRIKDKLAGTTVDDEISVVNSTLNINLFDPFSRSEICNIPVRSKACDHFDCFDLETFLETRNRNADSTVPDRWKCPICNGDARPHLLIVDGFMQEVRSELEKQGLLKTRAIILSEDGSWKAKAEVVEGVADHDDDTPAELSGQKTPGQHKTPAPQFTEVIDLGDSDED
ncbi:hypothetical protein SLS60_001133 [Paraconiothyrium brasiliense]|uniref:SP-RING-type domain-containing protein n=1 Tax=Paraconiothyrium brasiliense TaxID=300254 RepID=A0ABR3S8S3_9PLEO